MTGGPVVISGEDAEDSGWFRRAYRRTLVRRPLKILLSVAGISAFFLAYFWVLAHPLAPVVTMPVTALDRFIAFRPAALPLYVSLWIYITIVPALIVDRRELADYWLAALALSLIGLVTFLFWPTNVVWPEAYWSQPRFFAFFKSLDAPGNAFPSLHAAFAVFSAVLLTRLLREMEASRFVRAANWIWCIGILYSTVAIRQHVVLDMGAGAALGAAVGFLQLRVRRRGEDSEAVAHVAALEA